LGFFPEKRPFHPHLTLARIKDPRVTGVSEFLTRYQNFSLEEFVVENFHLYSSKLNPKGAIYTKVKTFSLL
jgi:2'-5' RNA ligase